MAEEKSVPPNVFEKELIDVARKHGVKRFLFIFSDPDRNPMHMTRGVLGSSGLLWSAQACAQLANKVKYMVDTRKLKREDDPEMMK